MKFVDRLRAPLRPALGLAFGLAVALAPAAAAEQLRSHFDTDFIMRAPGFFDLVALGEPGKPRWLVLNDPNAPSSPNRLVQTERELPAGTIAAALRRNVSFQDGTASTFIKQGPGHAGMILRMKDEANFVLLVADTATGVVVLSAWEGGKSSEIGRGQAAFGQPWQKLAVRLNGADASVTFGEKALFVAKDPRPAAGRAGLAAQGPGEASFDEFILDFSAAEPAK
jgi:hypothetical protein